MSDIANLGEWRGQEVVDSEGERIGKLEEVYFERGSREPGFGSVKTGLFGRRLSIFPLSEATIGRDYIRIPYRKDEVKDAPNVEPDGQLTGAEELNLFRHFGLDEPDSAGDDSRLVRYQTEDAANAEVAEAEAAAAAAARARQTGAEPPAGAAEREPQAAAHGGDAPPAEDRFQGAGEAGRPALAEDRFAGAGERPYGASGELAAPGEQSLGSEPVPLETRILSLERRIEALERRLG